MKVSVQAWSYGSNPADRAYTSSIVEDGHISIKVKGTFLALVITHFSECEFSLVTSHYRFSWGLILLKKVNYLSLRNFCKL